MKPIKIFKNQYGYSMGVSQRLQDGTYENGYFPVQFKKDVELDNQTDIIPTDWTISFYTNKEGNKVFKLCVWEFIIHQDMGQAVKKNNMSITAAELDNDPFSDFGEQVSIDDSDLD